MTILRKSVITVFLTIIAIVVGFIFLLKGCLAKYDERFARLPAMVFEKNGKTVIFSIVEFQKTTSYSRKGNMVRRSIRTSYYVQNNDGETAALLGSKKAKSGRSVKNHPVEILGPSGSTAWIFMGEPMAFDAFTLEKIADIAILEAKNPLLKDKFPAERKYYTYNPYDQKVYFTATDGGKWTINNKTLNCDPAPTRDYGSPQDAEIAAIEDSLAANKEAMDSLQLNKNVQAVKDYSTQKITRAEYERISKEYYAERSQLSKHRDELQEIQRKLEQEKRDADGEERNIENLQRINQGFSQSKSNQDTINGTWFGLYNQEELDQTNDNINRYPLSDETMRRKLFTSSYTVSKYGYGNFNKKLAKPVSGTDFLDGGFLLNKKTARPLLTGSGLYLVVHREKLGREGKVMLSALGKDGTVKWTLDTGLTDWSDWASTSGFLYVFGTDNKELSSSECNVLLCINLEKGSSARYDYFKNK